MDVGPLAKLIYASQNIVSGLESVIHGVPVLGSASPGLAIILWALIIKVGSYPVYERAIKFPYLLRREL